MLARTALSRHPRRLIRTAARGHPGLRNGAARVGLDGPGATVETLHRGPWCGVVPLSDGDFCLPVQGERVFR